jgi:hypothetical protein
MSREQILASIILQDPHRKLFLFVCDRGCNLRFCIPGEMMVRVYETRAEGERSAVQLAKYSSYLDIEKVFQVTEDAGGNARLFWKDTAEEVVLDVQGYIVKQDLPPLFQGHKFAHNLLPFMTIQYAHIVLTLDSLAIHCWHPRMLCSCAVVFQVSAVHAML